MRFVTLTCLIGLAGLGLAGLGPALAQQAPTQQTPAQQTPPPLVAPAPATSADAPAHRMTVRERFALANTTHDGKLTLDQAKSGFPAMAHLFDAIDKDHKGYITMDDIKAYYDAKRARQAAQAAAAQGAPPQGATEATH
jgi:hypothetical protein